MESRYLLVLYGSVQFQSEKFQTKFLSVFIHCKTLFTFLNATSKSERFALLSMFTDVSMIQFLRL